MSECRNIVVLGAGFAGVNCAQRLQKLFAKSPNHRVILVSRNDYIVYQPMLTETVEGSITYSDMAASLRKLLPGVTFYFREITDIHLKRKEIVLAPSFSHTPTILPYEHLVIALGNVTDFRELKETGLKEHALHFKDLHDSIRLREQIIRAVEAAHTSINPEERKSLLTFIVGGGGFSGVEIAASIVDLLEDLCKLYQLNCSDSRVLLVHSKDRLMDREVSPSLSRYAEGLLKKRGVEILLNCHLVKATPYQAFLDHNQGVIPTRTIVLTAPSSMNPLLEKIADLPIINKRLECLPTLQLKGFENIWAAGDCASIPNPAEEGGLAPPTAQFAVREGKLIAENIYAFEHAMALKNFRFKRLGMMASLGRHKAVAELFGKIQISGFLAWLMWRSVYLMKLPGIGRKVKVAVAWLLDLFIKDEPIQLDLTHKPSILHLHYEPGETIFHQADVGDFIYTIVKGSVSILRKNCTTECHIADLHDGDLFGELALLDQRSRSATVKALTACDIIAIPCGHMETLALAFPEVKERLLKLRQERSSPKN